MPQSLSNLLVHIVFSTKDHFPFLQPSIQDQLYPYLAKVCHELECPAKIINGMEDHVHIFCVLSRKESVSRLVGILKQHSSKWIKSKGQEWYKFQWQSGYGAFSIGRSQAAALTAYILNQKEHHKKVTFQEEYRKFLEAYQITYNEQYVWD